MSKIEELEEKIHQLRMEKLNKIEYIDEQMKERMKEYDELDIELQAVLKSLSDCPLKEVPRYQTIVRAIKARMEIVSGVKGLFAQLRLLNRNIQHEMEQLILLKMDQAEG